MDLMIVVWDHLNVTLVITAVVIEVATNVAMVREIVITTVIVPGIFIVEAIIVNNLVKFLIVLMTAVCSRNSLL